jgi:hypothetical protein
MLDNLNIREAGSKTTLMVIAMGLIATGTATISTNLYAGIVEIACGVGLVALREILKAKY